MNIQMTVFSVDPTLVQQDVTLPDGATAQATIKGKRVQLVSKQHGTLSLNLTGAQASDWSHEAGQAVTVSLT